MVFLHMTNHLCPSGLKKLYKQLGNWQAIPMSLGRLDHKLVVIPLQVIVILLINVKLCLVFILRHIINIAMTHNGNQEWKKN